MRKNDNLMSQNICGAEKNYLQLFCTILNKKKYNLFTAQVFKTSNEIK